MAVAGAQGCSVATAGAQGCSVATAGAVWAILPCTNDFTGFCASTVRIIV